MVQPVEQHPASAAAPSGDPTGAEASIGGLLASLGQALDAQHQAARWREQTLAARLDELGAQLAAGSERLDTIDQRSAGLVGWVAGIDDTVSELSARVATGLERLDEVERQAQAAKAALDRALARLEELEQLDERITATIGEATIARIELERLSTKVGERFDTLQVRVADVEMQVAEQVDVSAAVQLERLDELERAVAELDPDRLVRGV